ncbi:DUF805 domain-containing protein [Lentilactobacillus sp. SPB1-3]|uniref:DUF805 domain-containing protein n=1 Tax=Lentilactobacillus terminaliae TaxID=3003483 RepID=A0ACD5DC95_9LACO|nr:DUF805 domain-containing protein [Lentilactobacillus sp. SPB1-3]MCZ0977129.1 DUF805 domain-containing protein [Lentilactobacillus sp. SPB1-3]
MVDSYKKFWHNITNFSGTADRPDYWWPIIINYILGGIIVAIIEMSTGHHFMDTQNSPGFDFTIFSDIVIFIVWLGVLSLKVRRLHDTDRSGWWILITIVPLIGNLWFFILTLLPSKPNRWSQP